MACADGTKFCATLELEINAVNRDTKRDEIAILLFTVLLIGKPNYKNSVMEKVWLPQV
jgi:hypothetical protein